MKGPEQEPQRPKDDLCQDVVSFFEDDIHTTHPQLKTMISCVEIDRASERIAALANDLVLEFPIKTARGLSLFRDMVVLDFPVPDENGVSSFSAQSQAEESLCKGHLGWLSSEKEGQNERWVARTIVDTVLDCLEKQLAVVFEHIRAGTDTAFDFILISNLGRKEELLRAFLSWYAKDGDCKRFQRFEDLSIALVEKTERNFSSGPVPREKILQITRDLIVDVLFGFDTLLKIEKKHPDRTLSAFFQVSEPGDFGRSVVESEETLPTEKKHSFSSNIPGASDLAELPENMMYFLRLLLEHFALRDLWSELE